MRTAALQREIYRQRLTITEFRHVDPRWLLTASSIAITRLGSHTSGTIFQYCALKCCRMLLPIGLSIARANEGSNPLPGLCPRSITGRSRAAILGVPMSGIRGCVGNSLPCTCKNRRGHLVGRHLADQEEQGRIA
jgi:hypothetical protein